MSLGETFTWIHGGADYRWDTCLNWSPQQGLECYPDDSGDVAIVPAALATWSVDLVTVGPINQLTVRGNTTFGPPGTSQVTLRTGVFLIDATNANADLTVTMESLAKIQVP